MNDTKQLLALCDAWAKERSECNQREEGDNPVSSSRWEHSDDTAVQLLTDLVPALREKREVWTCTVMGPDQPLNATIHDTEDEAIDSLCVNHDPAGEYEGRNIVEELEAIGYVIDIDVHHI